MTEVVDASTSARPARAADRVGDATVRPLTRRSRRAGLFQRSVHGKSEPPTSKRAAPPPVRPDFSQIMDAVDAAPG